VSVSESPLLLGWPYAGLVLAAVLLFRLFTQALHASGRLRDPAFLLPLLWPMYLVHQFEEHGIDFLGRHFAFLGDLCGVLGHAGNLPGCPADPAFIFVVNVVACPMAFVLPLIFRKTRPLLALFGWSVPLVNAVSHIGSAVVHHAYNPGVVTSVVLFLPLGAWTVRSCLRARVLAPRQVPLIFMAGGALHAVLIGSLVLHERGVISRELLLAANALNGLIPLAAGLLVGRKNGLDQLPT
jgi:hypothetical protein